MITSKWIMGKDGIEDALSLRREVFIDEQGVSPQEEFDGLDDRAFHLIVYDDGIPAATGRLMFLGGYRIGRVAVKKDRRRRHLGDLAMRMLLVKAFDDGAEQVCIDAQTQAVGFYEKYGFKKTSDEFIEAGIPHYRMAVTKDGLIMEHNCKTCAKKDCPNRN